jgi:hypothetical protein
MRHRRFHTIMPHLNGAEQIADTLTAARAVALTQSAFGRVWVGTMDALTDEWWLDGKRSHHYTPFRRLVIDDAETHAAYLARYLPGGGQDAPHAAATA